MPSFKSLVADVKADNLTRWVEFKDGIEFQLRFVSKTVVQAIASNCNTLKYNKLTKQREPSINTDQMIAQLVEKGVVSWRGMTARRLQSLLPVRSDVADADLDSEIPFSKDDCIYLVKNAFELDAWIQENCTDVSMFKPDRDENQKNSSTSQDGSSAS